MYKIKCVFNAVPPEDETHTEATNTNIVLQVIKAYTHIKTQTVKEMQQILKQIYYRRDTKKDRRL